MSDLPPPGVQGGAVSTRVKVLAAAGAVVVLGGAAVAYLTLTGSDVPAQGLPRSEPRPAVSSPPRLSLTPISTPGVSEAGLNARNPFLGDLPTTTTTTTTTTTAATTPSTTTSSAGTSTRTTTATTSRTTSRTTAAGPVYVTLLSVGRVAPKYTALFLVNGARYDRDVGSTFGSPAHFSYDSTTVRDGRRCVRFSYGDEGHTLCPQEQINVA